MTGLRLADGDTAAVGQIGDGHETLALATVDDAGDLRLRGQDVGDDAADAVERCERLALQLG